MDAAVERYGKAQGIASRLAFFAAAIGAAGSASAADSDLRIVDFDSNGLGWYSRTAATIPPPVGTPSEHGRATEPFKEIICRENKDDRFSQELVPAPTDRMADF